MRHRNSFLGLFVAGLLLSAGCGHSASPTTSPAVAEQSQADSAGPLKSAASPGAVATHDEPAVAGPSNAAAGKLPEGPSPVDPTPIEAAPDPDEIKARELVNQLLSSSEANRPAIQDQITALGDKAVPALLALLVDGDECRPELLTLLHRFTGFTSPCEAMDFSIAVMPAAERADSPFRDHVVPVYQLDSILSATNHSDPPVRRGALRYLRALGYVGDDRIRLADAAASACQLERDPPCRAEARALRNEQVALAVKMTSQSLSCYREPALRHTAEWFAHLGAEAARLGLEPAQAEVRISRSFLATIGVRKEFDRMGRRESRRRDLERRLADAAENYRAAVQHTGNPHLVMTLDQNPALISTTALS